MLHTKRKLLTLPALVVTLLRHTDMTSTMILKAPHRQQLRQLALIALAAIASVLLAHIVFIQPGAPLEPGLDASWAYGVNYTFQKRLLLGRDIYFTFGPLGFLEHTRALTSFMLDSSTAFWSGCTILLGLLVFRLCWLATPSRIHTCVNLLAGTLLILTTDFYIFRLLMLIYTVVLLHWIDKRCVWLVLAGIICTISLLVKFSYGAVALSLFLPYLILATLRDRSWRQFSIGLTALIASYACIWWLIYGQLTGAVGYLQGGLQFSHGSTSVMALNPTNNWWAIAAFFSTFILCLIFLSIRLRQKWLPMPICFLGPLFVWSKYAFGREDAAHLGFLMVFVFYALPLLAITYRDWLGKLIVLISLVLCYITWGYMHTPAIGKEDFSPSLIIPKTISRHIFTPKDDFKQILDQESQARLKPLILPPTLRQLIGTASVDIYPWETLIAATNQLHWTPRPVYQNYISYTPFLDRANQQFYAGENAPQFIIWHYHDFADIDTRYSFNSDPLTLLGILQHYKRITCEQKFCVWQRTNTVQATEKDISPIEKEVWEQWIPVPSNASDVLRLHINAKRTLIGKLNLLLWKEGEITIDYRLKDNSIHSHDVVLDNAESGLWISPYVDSFYSGIQPELVTDTQWQQWQQAKAAEGYIESAAVSGSNIRIYGWGLLPFKTSATQRLFLLLKNEQHSYRIPAHNRPRPGITDYFKKTGIVDLDNCGFDEIFPAKNIAPGTYQLYFLVENEHEIALSAPQAVSLSVPDHLEFHNVDAVRLHTSRPWAFTPELTMHWSGLTFTGEKPW